MKTLRQLREDLVKADDLRAGVRVGKKVYWASSKEDSRWSHAGIYREKVPIRLRTLIRKGKMDADFGYYDKAGKKFYSIANSKGIPDMSEELPYRGGLQTKDYNITNV